MDGCAARALAHDRYLHTEVLEVMGFWTACYIQRPQSPVNRGFRSDGIPDCVLHSEPTVTCKHWFRQRDDSGLCVTQRRVTCTQMF